MSKKILVIILALFMIYGLHLKVKAETSSSHATSQITLHVENTGSTSSSSNPSNNESHENKKASTGKLPLTNAQRETGLLVGGFLLLGLTCLVVKRKRGGEHE